MRFHNDTLHYHEFYSDMLSVQMIIQLPLRIDSGKCVRSLIHIISGLCCANADFIIFNKWYFFI